MQKRIRISIGMLGLMLLITGMGMPFIAEAGRGHHKHHHHHHYYANHGHHHHHDSYAVFINHADVYYPMPYFSPYVQPRYQYNSYPAPAPVYGYTPNVMFDFYTGNGHFFIQY